MNPGNHLSGARLESLGSSLRIASNAGADVVRAAVRDGEAVVTLRSSESGTGATVECTVRTVRPTGPSAPPQVLGPYDFATQAEARSFGDELMLALEYLGCELVDGEGLESSTRA